jgi:hypothetical protein
MCSTTEKMSSPLKYFYFVCTQEVGLVAALQRRGIQDVRVVPIQRSDWFQVLRGLFDKDFLFGDAQPDGEAFAW